MRLWQRFSVAAVMCGAVGAACGGAGELSDLTAATNSSGSSSSSAAVTGVSSANTADLDAVLSSAITQNYLTAANQNSACAADANAVMQLVQALGAALGDGNLTAGAYAGAGVQNGNVAVVADANSAAVIAVFEQDLPQLQNALSALQQCVHTRCGGDANMPSIPTFPCGKPGSTGHAGDGNVTDGNSRSPGGNDPHHPMGPNDPNMVGTGSDDPNMVGMDPNMIVSGGSTDGNTTVPTTPVITGETAAGANADDCVSVVLGGQAFVGCSATGF